MVNIKKFQEKINNKYPNENLVVIEYNGAKNSCKIKCGTCGKILSYTHAENAIKKNKKILCQECGLIPKKKKTFEQSLKDRFPHDNLTILNFSSHENIVDIQCNVCGNIEHVIGKNILKRKNYFCKKCYPQKYDILESSKQDFLNFIRTSDKWVFDENKLKDITSSNSLVECECTCCHNKSGKSMRDYKRGRGCKYCAGTLQKTTEEFKPQLDDDYILLSEYINANTKILLKHSCGFVYSTTPHNYLNGKRCPKCMRKQSQGELKIQNFLEKNNIEYIEEYGVKIKNHLLRFDFYLPKNDLYIEFQGIQYHKPIDFFGGENRFYMQQEYDQLKREYCGEHLLEINYLDINNIEEILTNINLKSSTTILEKE